MADKTNILMARSIDFSGGNVSVETDKANDTIYLGAHSPTQDESFLVPLSSTQAFRLASILLEEVLRGKQLVQEAQQVFDILHRLDSK